MNKLITDAMLQARYEYINLMACDPKVLEAMFWGGLSTIIHKFDPEDKSTWPNHKRAHDGQYWLCVIKKDGLTTIAPGVWYGFKWGIDTEIMETTIVAYFDPADLLGNI